MKGVDVGGMGRVPGTTISGKMGSTTLSIVILNWNTVDLVKDCLQSVDDNVALDYEVIVVDNGSIDGSVAMVEEHFSHHQLIVLPENLGFSAGNNVALAVARGRYILLLNPDTVVLPHALQPLIDFMEDHPRAGIVGPTLWNPDGSLQHSTTPFPTLWNEFLRFTMLHRSLLKSRRATARQNEPHSVDAVSGAALLIRRACYEEIGPLDSRFFMFYEDTDWCKRAREADWEIYFVPSPGIVHIRAAASSRFARTRTLLDSHRSTIRYFEKHHSLRSVAILRAITLAGALVRSLRATAKWILGRDRADQCHRLAAYRKMVRWALVGDSSDAEEQI
jgi:N-acetylglucosaminyl-diphospho-decaprenol L-rhamnosyltransferase